MIWVYLWAWLSVFLINDYLTESNFSYKGMEWVYAIVFTALWPLMPFVVVAKAVYNKYYANK